MELFICKICVLIFSVLVSIASAFPADIYHTSNYLKNSNAILATMAMGKYTPPEEMDSSFWINQAQSDLEERLHQLINLNVAKNVIFFMGDGMSIATLTAARIRKGQLQGNTGEESILASDTFPYAGLSKTYCTNGQTPDSACTATAYLCGVKTNMMMTGVNAHVNFNNCSASADTNNHVESIALWAQRAGKSTGIVTTTTVTHASPSAAYAHVANRMWETDADIVAYEADPSGGCVDIATQLIKHDPGRNFNVILGGGMEKFLPNTDTDAFGGVGLRLDGVNLIDEWRAANPNGEFVTTRDDLLNVNADSTDHLFGTFSSGDMEFNIDAPTTNPSQPRLKEMTVKALEVLQKNSQGYFLFVEGGRIDHGHHYTKAGYALDETLEFQEAIQAAIDMTSDEDTLIVVTSDHAHTMSIGGYPGRGNNILGVNEYDTDYYGTPYNTLNYAIGIEQYLVENGMRQNLTGKIDDLSLTPSYIKSFMGTHAGEDVAVFAKGPYAHLFSGVMQQNVIPHMMAYAACIGNGLIRCNPFDLV